MGAPGLD